MSRLKAFRRRNHLIRSRLRLSDSSCLREPTAANCKVFRRPIVATGIGVLACLGKQPSWLSCNLTHPLTDIR
jgi:hypothetical protein